MSWGNYIFNGGPLGHIHFNEGFNIFRWPAPPPAVSGITVLNRAAIIPAANPQLDISVDCVTSIGGIGAQMTAIDTTFQSQPFGFGHASLSIRTSQAAGGIGATTSSSVNHAPDAPNIFGIAFPILCPGVAALGKILNFFGI